MCSGLAGGPASAGEEDVLSSACQLPGCTYCSHSGFQTISSLTSGSPSSWLFSEQLRPAPAHHRAWRGRRSPAAFPGSSSPGSVTHQLRAGVVHPGVMRGHQFKSKMLGHSGRPAPGPQQAACLSQVEDSRRPGRAPAGRGCVRRDRGAMQTRALAGTFAATELPRARMGGCRIVSAPSTPCSHAAIWPSGRNGSRNADTARR